MALGTRHDMCPLMGVLHLGQSDRVTGLGIRASGLAESTIAPFEARRKKSVQFHGVAKPSFESLVETYPKDFQKLLGGHEEAIWENLKTVGKDTARKMLFVCFYCLCFI